MERAPIRDRALNPMKTRIKNHVICQKITIRGEFRLSITLVASGYLSSNGNFTTVYGYPFYVKYCNFFRTKNIVTSNLFIYACV